MSKLMETNLPAMFQLRAEKYGSRACVSYKKNGVYTDISWSEMNRMIRSLATYLVSIGVKKGDRIGLFSENRYEWWIADQAILSIGAIDVPIYATNSSAEASFILKDSESKVCLVSTEDHVERVLKVKKSLPKLKQIIVFNEISKGKKDIIPIKEIFEKGGAAGKKVDIDKLIKAVKPTDVATIMYTSGTTGNPKGVMLTHNNFYLNCVNVFRDLSRYLDDSEVFFSFLPLSHVLERTCGYYCAVYIGGTVKFAESIETLLEDINAVRPTMVICVPRIYEKIRAGILSKVSDASPVKKALFNFAVSTARKNLPYVCTGTQRKGLFAVRYNIMDKLVLHKLRANIGMDRIKFAISGGAPLSVTDAEFFIGMGIEILEGFGLTETSPIMNYNRPREIAPGTVGRALQETEIKISEDGEVLIKGPQVMKGYYKNPKATKDVFTNDGFFRTGDIGEID
ncbi:MAG: long-chain fatty acid--CoA ligase, partial [Spirochaetes bacterium]|nr:long-chain fatty acid--CoA ligase [Spirochaetota bacterium]